MKLSDVVSYKNHLDSLSSGPEAQNLLNKISSIVHVVKSSGVQVPEAMNQLIEIHTH